MQKFGILKKPLLDWNLYDIRKIVETCIIIHNMTVKCRLHNLQFNDLIAETDGENGIMDVDDDDDESEPRTLFDWEEGGDGVDEFCAVLSEQVTLMTQLVEDAVMYQNLMNDLVYHINNDYNSF